MALTLYRRHISACPVRKSSLSPKAKRLAMECSCPIWIYGRTNSNLIPRQSTGFTDLAEAEALRDSLVAKGKDEAVHGPKLDDCAARFLDARRHELGPKSTGQYELILGRFREYCRRRGVFFIRELNVDLLETFKVDGLPGLADSSRATFIVKIRAFLRDAFRRGWIEEPLVYKMRPYRAKLNQKDPYSDEEVDKILAGALALKGGTYGYAAHPGTFRLLLELMLETGMRVGDAVRYDPKLTVRGEQLWIYTYAPQKQKKIQKTKRVDVFLTEGLKRAIDECDWLSSSLPFSYGDSADHTYLANQVYKRMQSVGEKCGVSDCRPHRLRDTFAVRKLLAGLQLEDVSRLLGHSSVKMTETYYAKWTTTRARRLERLLAETIVDANGDGSGNR